MYLIFYVMCIVCFLVGLAIGCYFNLLCSGNYISLVRIGKVVHRNFSYPVRTIMVGLSRNYQTGKYHLCIEYSKSYCNPRTWFFPQFK